MDVKALAKEVSALPEAYYIRCEYTHMPYVECSEETVNDQVFLFEKKDEADAFCASRKEKGIELTARKLAVMPMPNRPGMSISAVRSFLGSLPSLDVDVVSYKNAKMEASQELYVSDVLPGDFIQKMTTNPMYNPLLQLTGLFFCQNARMPQEQRDPEELKITEEEFSANLVKARLLIPVLPPENQPLPESGKPMALDIRTCRFPAIRLKENELYMPIFTDANEMQKYVGTQKIGCIQLPFSQLLNCSIQNGTGYLLNPKGFALPFRRDQIPGLAKRFGITLQRFNGENAESTPAAQS